MSSRGDGMCHHELNGSDSQVAFVRWPRVWCIKRHVSSESDVSSGGGFKPHGELRSVRSSL